MQIFAAAGEIHSYVLCTPTVTVQLSCFAIRLYIIHISHRQSRVPWRKNKTELAVVGSGWSALTENIITRLLHLASWHLPDSQLSVAISCPIYYQLTKKILNLIKTCQASHMLDFMFVRKLPISHNPYSLIIIALLEYKISNYLINIWLFCISWPQVENKPYWPYCIV